MAPGEEHLQACGRAKHVDPACPVLLGGDLSVRDKAGQLVRRCCSELLSGIPEEDEVPGSEGVIDASAIVPLVLADCADGLGVVSGLPGNGARRWKGSL